MRPYSKIVQIVSVARNSWLVVLCEDGSVWHLDTADGKFLMITEMENGKYLVPTKENDDE
jgi:hypothetical protein